MEPVERTAYDDAFTRLSEKLAPATYQDWVRAVRERDAQAAQTKRKTRRSGY